MKGEIKNASDRIMYITRREAYFVFYRSCCVIYYISIFFNLSESSNDASKFLVQRMTKKKFSAMILMLKQIYCFEEMLI